MSKVSIKSIPAPDPVVYRITMDLTENDAQVLHDIFRNIGGDVEGDRKITERIRVALLAYGIAGGVTRLSGNIVLED